MAYEIDITEVSTCVWRRARRTTRRLTQLYDRALAPSGLNASQFDILANLFGASLSREKSIAIGDLAQCMGIHPTTLTRDLRHVIASGLASRAAGGSDRRVRLIQLTPAGRDALKAAVPLWREAQQRVRRELGPEAMQTLSAALDHAFARLPARRD